MSGNIIAGTTVSGNGAITLANIRMAFTVPGLGSALSPKLKVTIKNDDGTGTAVPSLTLAVGDSYSTGGSVGATGHRAHGVYAVTNTTYQVLTVTLNTSFISTNTLQFRGLVGTNGTAGLHIDKIEVESSGISSSSTGSSASSIASQSSSFSSTSSTASSAASFSMSPGSPIGFASMNGGTTGGAGGTTTTVSTGTDLQNAINNATGPIIIYVNGTITPANSGSLTKIDVKGSDDPEADWIKDISIIGVGTSGELNGIGIKIWRAKNIIIRNLKIHHVNIGDKDAIEIQGPGGNVWIDHNELYSDITHGKDYYDGACDVSHGADYVTISYNYFHDHYKASLVGHSDNNGSEDTGKLHVTYYGNYFTNVSSRTPLFRFGTAHIFNNYFENFFDAKTGSNIRMGAVSRIEGNYYDGVDNPILSMDSTAIGYWDLGPGSTDSNLYFNTNWGPGPITVDYTNAYLENFLDTTSYTPPYSYTLKTANEAKTDAMANSGVGKL